MIYRSFRYSYKECLLTTEEIRLAAMPASIKKKITLWRSVISNTRIAEVNGDLVIPVKKATMPERTSKFVLDAERSKRPAT